MLIPVRKLIDEWPLGMVFAVVLTLLPLAKIVGLAFSVMLLLRKGDVYAQLCYLLVALVAGFAFNGYSVEGYETIVWGLVLFFLPLWGMAMVLRRVRSLTLALEVGALTLGLMIVLGQFMYGEPTIEGIKAYIDARVQAGTLPSADYRLNDLHMTLQEAIAELLVIWPMFMYMMQAGLLLLARYWQSWLFYKGGFRADFYQVRLHQAAALIATVLIVIKSTGLSDALIMAQLSTVALLLLQIAGLAFVHWYVAYQRMNRWWLIGLYTVLFAVPFVVLPLFGVLALVDSGLNLRKRIIAAKLRGA